MNRKIRVLQSMDTIGVGGTEVFVMNLYRFIDKEMFEFSFVVYDDYKTEYLEEVLRNGNEVYRFHQKHSNKLQNYLDQKRFVRDILRKHSYDIVHCNGNSFLGILRAGIPAKRQGLHVITHSHNMGEEKNDIIDRLGKGILKIKVSSIAEYGYACSNLAGKSKYTESFIKSLQYRIIDNGIDQKKFRFNQVLRKKVRDAMGIHDGTFLIGHVGRFEYPKNQSYLFDVFSEVLKIEHSARLVLVGEGVQRSEFEEKIRKLGITDKIILLGLRMDVNEIYNAMDVFVLPSIHEGFPFVLVEAQMNGLRCIVTENMSKDVDISGGVTFLSTNIEPKKWAEEIINTRNRLSKEQVQKVIERYNIRNIVSLIEKDYKSLLK